jgi:hypothetical protein
VLGVYFTQNGNASLAQTLNFLSEMRETQVMSRRARDEFVTELVDEVAYQRDIREPAQRELTLPAASGTPTSSLANTILDDPSLQGLLERSLRAIDASVVSALRSVPDISVRDFLSQDARTISNYFGTKLKVVEDVQRAVAAAVQQQRGVHQTKTAGSSCSRL